MYMDIGVGYDSAVAETLLVSDSSFYYNDSCVCISKISAATVVV